MFLVLHGNGDHVKEHSGTRNMSADSRKDFLVASIANHFGYNTNDGAITHIFDSKELQSFLDSGSCYVLGSKVELIDNVKLVQVYNDLNMETKNCLVFFKLRPTTITPDNLHSNILVSTMIDTPLETLFHALQKVYAPLLLKGGKWSKVRGVLRVCRAFLNFWETFG